MLKLLRKDSTPEPTPGTYTLNSAAAILGLDTVPNGVNAGFLAQAKIIEELARRIVELERLQK